MNGDENNESWGAPASGGPLDVQPGMDQVPPGSPPGVAVDTVEPPPPPRGWGLFEASPVIAFLLMLAGLSLGTGTDTQAEPPNINVTALLFTQGVLYAIILLYIFSVVRGRHRLPFWAGLKWQPVSAGRFLLAGLGVALVVQLISLPARKELPIERLFHSRDAALQLAAFGILVAPLVEEIIFRGFLYRAFEKKWGAVAAVWISAILFATIHVPQLQGGWAQIAAIFFVGLSMSWMRGRTGSLAAPYWMHLGYNTTLFVMLYAATEGFRRFDTLQAVAIW